MSKQREDDTYDAVEAQKRFEAALRGGLSTSAKPLKEKPKIKQPAAKKAAKAVRKLR